MYLSMDLHEHCRNCIITRCSMYPHDCPVVPCEYGCEMEMHECKMTDHRNVCQNQRISCINSYYGCPVSVVRAHLSSHLAKCPANVVLCTMEWGRYPLYSEERLRWVPFIQRNPALVKGFLDVELALRDQKVINKIRQQKCSRGLSKTLFQLHEPNTRISYERARCIREEINTAIAVNGNLDVISVSEQACINNLETNEMETQQVLVDVVESEGGELNDIPECPQLLDTHSGLGVNLNLETIPKFLKHNFMYRVPCNQLLQRREFSAHFKNVHSDIHGGLGWMEQRCTFAQYGCPYVRCRLRPATQQGSIVFSQHLGTFGVKPLKSIDAYSQESYLTLLPSELLEGICKWLDGFSLCNLSLTCKILRRNVFRLLSKRGVVVVDWKKRIYEDGSTSWMIHKKCWSFTAAFTEVRQWVHSKTPFMSSHLEKCPYYCQHVSETPFNYVDI